jgi:integrase
VTVLRLKYLHVYKDRHGKQRTYFRRPRQKQIPIPGLPGSREFHEAYQAALEERPISVGIGRSKPGTFSALISGWYQSGEFLNLAPQTKNTYTGILERFREEHGDKPVRRLEASHVRAIVAKRKNTPAQANRVLTLLHQIMRFAVENDWRKDDPTVGVRKLKYAVKGHKTWNSSQLAEYEDYWPVGTKERLAFDCFLYTAQRISDVCRMEMEWIADGVMTITQKKTGETVYIPVVKPLLASIKAVGVRSGPLNVTGRGKARTASGFHNWFSQACRTAGLPRGISAHGLRKVAATALAERGRTTHEIMAITGHKSIAEVERYTREANKKRLAKAAMEGMYDDDFMPERKTNG